MLNLFTIESLQIQYILFLKNRKIIRYFASISGGGLMNLRLEIKMKRKMIAVSQHHWFEKIKKGNN